MDTCTILPLHWCISTRQHLCLQLHRKPCHCTVNVLSFKLPNRFEFFYKTQNILYVTSNDWLIDTNVLQLRSVNSLYIWSYLVMSLLRSRRKRGRCPQNNKQNVTPDQNSFKLKLNNETTIMASGINQAAGGLSEFLKIRSLVNHSICR